MSERRADSRSENRSNSPRESSPGRHGRDRIELPPLQPTRKHQPGHQLPRISALDLPIDKPPGSLLPTQRQGAGSSGPLRGKSEPNRQELLRHEAQEQQYRSPFEKHEAAQQFMSGRAAPATHHSAENDVPSGSAGIERDLSEADLDKIFMRKEKTHPSYKTLAWEADGQYTEEEIRSYCKGRAQIKAKAKKEERK